tara:strand:- start:898 stop:1107 length:210 start_codon:yes stop_codon:yes gene_type:complete
MDGAEKMGLPSPNSPLGIILKDINSGIKIDMPIYPDKITNPKNNNLVDKFFRLKKSLKVNDQITRPNEI